MITINMTKAKDIAHTARRLQRSEAFAPLDIKVSIPDEAEAAEASRKIIRVADATIQTDMDAATTPEALKAVMVGAADRYMLQDIQTDIELLED